ncbi:MAG: hypothetical protein IJG83_04110, partial [Thermoguttaceae bacterium]|nr:hypothetical protein [Thermoguttaceae bacterium]
SAEERRTAPFAASAGITIVAIEKISRKKYANTAVFFRDEYPEALCRASSGVRGLYLIFFLKPLER